MKSRRDRVDLRELHAKCARLTQLIMVLVLGVALQGLLCSAARAELTFQVLYSFRANDSVRNPNSKLLAVADGSFYCTTTRAVFRIAPGTVPLKICDLPTSPNLFGFAFGGLAEGPDGNLYGTTSSEDYNGSYMGDPGDTVYAVDRAGSCGTFLTFGGTNFPYGIGATIAVTFWNLGAKCKTPAVCTFQGPFPLTPALSLRERTGVWPLLDKPTMNIIFFVD